MCWLGALLSSSRLCPALLAWLLMVGFPVSSLWWWQLRQWVSYSPPTTVSVPFREMCSLCLQCRGLLDFRTTSRLCMVLHGFACLLIRCRVLLAVNLRCALLFRCIPSSFVAASGSLPRGGILLAAWAFTPLLLQTL